MYVTLDCKVDCGLSTRKRILSNSEARDTSCKLTSLPNESKENFCSTYQQSITYRYFTFFTFLFVIALPQDINKAQYINTWGH